MRAVRWMVGLGIGMALSAGVAAANDAMEPIKYREPRPGSAALAATGNILFAPVRLAFTAIGAELGGLTGWLTAGNRRAASDIWTLFDGQGFLQPEMMYGEEALQIGELQFHMHVTKP